MIGNLCVYVFLNYHSLTKNAIFRYNKTRHYPRRQAVCLSTEKNSDLTEKEGCFHERTYRKAKDVTYNPLDC